MKPTLVSSAAICAATGYGKAVLSDLSSQGIIKQAERGKWDALDTLGIMVRRLREKDAGSEDRQRKNKAEADSAEADALERSKTMCSIEDAKLYWSDGRIAVRQAIERSDLTPTQKTKLLATIAKIHPKPPEPI